MGESELEVEAVGCVAEGMYLRGGIRTMGPGHGTGVVGLRAIVMDPVLGMRACSVSMAVGDVTWRRTCINVQVLTRRIRLGFQRASQGC